MTRKSKSERSTGYTILLTDDNLDYLQMTRLLLEREGHTVLTAGEGHEALRMLRQTKVDLLLLDYYMPGLTGEQVVTELRRWNPVVQVILQTGYASEQPPRELLRRLDIQGYYDKSEGPDKLLLWTEVGLKAARAIQLVEKGRKGLQYIVDATPEMHRIQPLADLLPGILRRARGLLGAANSFGGLFPDDDASPGGDSFLAMVEDNELIVRASNGRLAERVGVEAVLSGERLVMVREAMDRGQITSQGGVTIVPLRVSEVATGMVYLGRSALQEHDIELLQVFANQAAVAIHNTQLYEMATLDPVTGAYFRTFFEQWMVRELRSAYSTRQPVSLLLADIDGMKAINDSAGHLAGDEALSAVGKSLKEAVRTSDIIGRYGGDEFAVMLPQTPLDGAERVARRVLQLVSQKAVRGVAGDRPLAVSLGLAVLEPFGGPAFRGTSTNDFDAAAKALFQRADGVLYEAKRAGGNQLGHPASVAWGEVLSA